MTLRTTTSLTAPASIPGVHRQVGPAVTCQLPRKLPRFGATWMGAYLVDAHLREMGHAEAADAMLADFIQFTEGAGETEDAP